MSKKLDDMLAGVTPENRHAEVDFGEAVGREAEAQLSMSFFKSYPPNEHGDDFVVGDLHGHRQALMEELTRQGFDPARDRLFCTGDLIDRGPDSFGTLGLIFEPWFHFVRGNHEDDLPDFINFEFSKFPGWRPSYCDQEWLYGLHETQVQYLIEMMLPRLADAPVVLRVQGAHGFWMVHADRSEFGGYHNPVALLDDLSLPFAKGDNQLEVLLWSRRLLKQMPHADLIDRGLFQAVAHHELAPNVGLTFVGHSFVEQATLYRSHLFIDTGAGTVPEGRLTVLRVKDVLDRLLIDSTIKRFNQVLKALADEDRKT